MATEIAYLTLKPDIDLDDGESEAGKAWKEALALIATAEGYKGSSYGRTLESPDVTIWFINWESLASHHKFAESAIYKPFRGAIGNIITSSHLNHFEPTSFPPTVVTHAPVIEFVTFFDIEPHFFENLKKFIEAIDPAKPEGYYGYSIGPVLEEIVRHTDVGKEGVAKGKAAVLLVGWETKEAHLAFRATQPYKDNIHYLREGLSGLELFHVPFKTT